MNSSMPRSAAAVPLFIDSDNALWFPFGDVDDAFALAALLRSGVPDAAIATTHGNMSALRVRESSHLRRWWDTTVRFCAATKPSGSA